MVKKIGLSDRERASDKWLSPVQSILYLKLDFVYFLSSWPLLGNFSLFPTIFFDYNLPGGYKWSFEDKAGSSQDLQRLRFIALVKRVRKFSKKVPVDLDYGEYTETKVTLTLRRFT